jgi:hypothetical protein
MCRTAASLINSPATTIDRPSPATRADELDAGITISAIPMGSGMTVRCLNNQPPRWVSIEE